MRCGWGLAAPPYPPALRRTGPTGRRRPSSTSVVLHRSAAGAGAENKVYRNPDWKYASGLELTDPGLDRTAPSEFRCRLVHGQADLQLLDTLLERCRDLGLIRERGRQRTDSTRVLAAVRVLNRLERVGETLRTALDELAVIVPEWLRALAPAEWYQRYGKRVENDRLPKADAAREELLRCRGPLQHQA